MFYIQKGADRDLVFLHGWGADHRCFMPLIDRFSASMRVTAVDFWGHGNTPPPDKAFTIFDFCDTLYDTLISAGVTKADFICHSFGARVGILIAAKHPEIVNKLLITGGAGIKPKRGLRYRIKVRWYKFKKLLAKVGLINKKRLEKVGSADYRALSGIMRETFVKVVNQDLTPYLSKIQAPTLLLWGENDRDTPLYMAHKMEKLISGSGLVVLNNAGHFAFLDSPRRFGLIAENFLKD